MLTNANGESTNTWIRIAEKNGPIAIILGLTLWAFWQFNLIPNERDRHALIEVLTKTAQSNSTSMHAVGESTASINETLKIINNELEGQTALRMQAMDTMSAFAKEMREVNPSNAIKLDRILSRIDEDIWNKKLDIIIEKIDEAHPEANNLEQ